MVQDGSIGLMSAVPLESALILEGLSRKRINAKEGMTSGRVGGSHVVHINSGICAANAAHAATLLIRRYSPRVMVLFGIGGAYPDSGLEVGGIAVASSETYADLGVLTSKGAQGLEITGFPLLSTDKRKYFNEFCLDKGLIRQALKAAGRARQGLFLTVSMVTGTRGRAEELEQRFKDPICENMEGAAVAQICARYGVPLLEVRGISNMVEDRDMRRWKRQAAAENCQRWVLKFLEQAGRAL